ncbi:MAG TPA: sensor histidine kinase, partial [Acidimicrobiia bacterium]|nr:sensor histidine kinase [Acidimicrobiia bacterium]
WGFSRLRSTEDDLMTWLAAGCMLFGLASFEYLAFPSIFSEFIYVGDFLRLAGVMLLLVGGAREIRGYWQRTAAMDERRKLAHDLHDGVAQELALIATIARRMEVNGSTRDTRRLADAAQHALDESRLVISTLAGAGNVAEQLALTARDAGHRFDLAVELDMPETLDLPGQVAEALLRIVREAITNAGHHAGATRVKVQVKEGPPATVITVSDDGVGFDVDETTGGFGLTSMRERAEAMGATFTMESLPGQGTTIRVEIP